MKNKINYNLLNVLLVLLIIISIIVLITNTFFSHLINSIFLPIVLSFLISYSFYPFIKILNKKFSYNISCILFLLSLITIVFISFYFLYYSLKDEYHLIIKDINKFFYSYNITNDNLFMYLKRYLTINNSFSIINYSYSLFIQFILIIILSVYFTFNMDRIRKKLIKNELFSLIDQDLFSYYKGFYIVILLEALEHLLIYYIIGHPYYLLIGALSIITSLIPFIGPIILNIFALISAYFISNSLFFITAVVLILLPIFNNYFIEPKIYNKTICISFLSLIISCFIFSLLFSVWGFILSIPLYIAIKNIYLYYLKDSKI